MKQGFTLVELLGVIVVLAFVALITIPIVLSVINKSDSSATRRSAENYRKAVKDAVARENLSGNKFYPKSCDVITSGPNKGYLNCNLVNNPDEYKVLVVKMEGTVPLRGNIRFEDSEPVETDLYYGNETNEVHVKIYANGKSEIIKN